MTANIQYSHFLLCIAIFSILFETRVDATILNKQSISMKSFNSSYLECFNNGVLIESLQLKVLAEYPINMSTTIGRFLKIHTTGKLLVLCYFTDGENKTPWIIKNYEISNSTSTIQRNPYVVIDTINKSFELSEVASNDVAPLSSLNPRISHYEESERVHRITCSNRYPARENQNLQLIRILPNGTRTPVILKPAMLSASFDVEADQDFLSMKYDHVIHYESEYFNNSFECETADSLSNARKSEFTKRIMTAIPCENDMMKVEMEHHFTANAHKYFNYICSCPNSYPEPKFHWQDSSGQIVTGRNLQFNKMNQFSEKYCCYATQQIKWGTSNQREMCMDLMNKTTYPESCQLIKIRNRRAQSGVYEMEYGRYSLIKVFCEMESKDQPWMVIQRRINGTQKFDKSWISYKNGFGDLNGEFWFGNEKLHEMTSVAPMKIRFDLWNQFDRHSYAEYSEFSVANEGENYRLNISGYSGDAGDSMKYHNGMMFSTMDKDNDKDLLDQCSKLRKNSGWWFKSCDMANPNGQYLAPGIRDDSCIEWETWTGHSSLKKTIIKIAYR